MDITIDPGHRQEFFDQMQKFAARHGFKIIIDTTDPTGNEFLIDMNRSDVDIFGNNVLNQGKYEFGFFDHDRQRPASVSAINAVMSDLQVSVGEVSGAVFSVVQR